MDATQCITDDAMNTITLFCLSLRNVTHIVEKNLKIFMNGNSRNAQDFP